MFHILVFSLTLISLIVLQIRWAKNGVYLAKVVIYLFFVLSIIVIFNTSIRYETTVSSVEWNEVSSLEPNEERKIYNITEVSHRIESDRVAYFYISGLVLMTLILFIINRYINKNEKKR